MQLERKVGENPIEKDRNDGEYQAEHSMNADESACRGICTNDAMNTQYRVNLLKSNPNAPKGLELIENFISIAQQSLLVSFFDSLEWHGKGNEPNSELKRRTLQFGHLFLYKTRKLVSKIPIPNELKWLLEMVKFNLGIEFDHLVVNEYECGQGIMPHVDANLFGPVICVLSLLSPCLMTFNSSIISNDETLKAATIDSKAKEFKLKLNPTSILVMADASRYDYKHSISKDAIEELDGEIIERSRRISITFRTICH